MTEQVHSNSAEREEAAQTRHSITREVRVYVLKPANPVHISCCEVRSSGVY